ncbi:unnamed protein product [Brassicogethes aeneus]|uniref:Protein sleepless n=1 Tax=Brassicogethes aeneus TaxID=1431903 RepID=A0A9P0FQD8_BRAAE|nr:unnamed protein product [Brassicogethes aeneus]
MAFRKSLGFLVVAAFYIQNGFGLQCWQCSSDIEPECRDQFNYSNYVGGGSNYLYSGNQGQYGGQYDQGGRQYDQGRGYDRPYDRFDQNSQRGYNRPVQQFSSRQYPQLVNCDDQGANLRRMKNVCYKRKQTSTNGYTTIIRRCETVPLDTYAGTCYDPVQRGISVNFCEYCDYDGCNGATSVKINVLTALVPLLAFLIYKGLML